MRGARCLVSLWLLNAALAICGRSAAAQTAPTCTITTTPVSFGVYNVFSNTPLTSTGSLTYHCTGNVPTITIWMSKGQGTTNNPRQMVSGTNRLNYYLCQDVSCATLWGDRGYPSDYGPVRPGTAWVSLNVYGSIPAGQDVPAGIYTDTMLVEIDY
jgi:spore coat protein U-like protein